MFIGRKNELTKLNKLYFTNKFQLPIIYGRRRVGKTTLINEFIKDKPHIYFTAIESNKEQNLESISRCIYAYENDYGNDSIPVYKSLENALEHIFELSRKKRIIFVIDEYPYLAKADKTVSSILQRLIDENKDTSQLFLILCGSSMSFMEEQVLGYQSPLYGRRTAQFKVHPFSFYEVSEYMSAFSKKELLYLYAISGGTPQYFIQFDGDNSFEDNIKSNVLEPTCYLFEEPQNLLKQEVREATLYNSIITAIANGSSRVSEIASKTGAETSACTTCLKRLISLEIVKRETPYGEKEGKKSIYTISDNLFRFWYRFIFKNYSALQNEMIDLVYKSISSELDSFIGPVFEEICKQYLWSKNQLGELPITFTSLGRWWGTNKSTKSQEEIDIIASDGSDAIICECKWKNEKIGISTINKLIERSKLFNYGKKHLFIFAKTGFTDECVKIAKSNNVTLIEFNDMF